VRGLLGKRRQGLCGGISALVIQAKYQQNDINESKTNCFKFEYGMHFKIAVKL